MTTEMAAVRCRRSIHPSDTREFWRPDRGQLETKEEKCKQRSQKRFSLIQINEHANKATTAFKL